MNAPGSPECSSSDRARDASVLLHSIRSSLGTIRCTAQYYSERSDDGELSQCTETIIQTVDTITASLRELADLIEQGDA